MFRAYAVTAAAAGVATGLLWPHTAPQPVATPSTSTVTTVALTGPWWGTRPDPRPRPKPRPSRDQVRWSCSDPVARLLHRAGFRGDSLRTAWAIVMRESWGENLRADSPYFTGAYGIFQVQESAHSGKPWYSRSAMLDPDRQARLVYLHLSARGTDFRHWGIGHGGTVDTTFYGGWSGDQVWRWIAEPFYRYWGEWPCGRP